MLSQVLGFIGTGLVVFAYLPQITHLVREHCSAGISLYAYGLWCLSSLLLLLHAFSIHDSSFIALQSVNLLATATVLFFAWKYHDNACPLHRTKGV